MKVTINVDGQEYDFDTITRASNRDAMALEDALGCTFETFMKRFGQRFRQIGDAIKAAPVNEDGTPNLDDADTSISARDTTALVFLARRRAGERDLKFDDVEFELASFKFGAEGAPDEVTEPPDAALAAVDPTSTPGETPPTGSGEPSSPSV